MNHLLQPVPILMQDKKIIYIDRYIYVLLLDTILLVIGSPLLAMVSVVL